MSDRLFKKRPGILSGDMSQRMKEHSVTKYARKNVRRYGKKMSDRISKDMPERVSEKECQEICQKEFLTKCYKIRQKECVCFLPAVDATFLIVLCKAIMS